MLFDWINTIPHTSCLLINDIAGLRNGVALCDAVAYVLGKNKFKEVYRRSAPKEAAEGKAIHNFGIVLKHLEYKEKTASDLIADDEQIIAVLRHIQEIGEDKSLNPKKSPRFVSPRANDPSNLPL